MNIANSFSIISYAIYLKPKFSADPGLILVQTGNLGLLVLWHILHLFVSIWYFVLGLVYVLESYLISAGILKSYKALNVGKLQYLAIVVESEDAYETSKVIELLQWLEAIGVKHVCLYDTEGNGALLE
jgi:ditrans,polycis-polyprenyl diphosphate synthase